MASRPVNAEHYYPGNYKEEFQEYPNKEQSEKDKRPVSDVSINDEVGFQIIFIKLYFK